MKLKGEQGPISTELWRAEGGSSLCTQLRSNGTTVTLQNVTSLLGGVEQSLVGLGWQLRG